LAKEEQKKISALLAAERLKLEKADADVAKKLMQAIGREDHRRDKRIEFIHSEKYQIEPSFEYIANQWEHAEAEVEG